MASATRGILLPSSLCCRPLTSQSKFPSRSLRCMPISTTTLSIPKYKAKVSASASASATYTAVKPKEGQGQGQAFPEGEEEGGKRSSLNPSSFEYTNTMHFGAPYNVEIFVDENESEDSVTYRFRREVLREGILQEVKRRQYHETNQDIKKRKGRDAVRRARNGRLRRALKRKRREEIEDDNKGDDDDDEDDNWQLPEEDIGF